MGLFEFEPGWYIYTGSAMGGLEHRLRRHAHGSTSRRLHWHIDYLAAHGEGKEFRVADPSEISECGLNSAVGNLEGASIPAPGFGSSDCACRSHLHRLPVPRWPELECLKRWHSAEII